MTQWHYNTYHSVYGSTYIWHAQGFFHIIDSLSAASTVRTWSHTANYRITWNISEKQKKNKKNTDMSRDMTKPTK